MQMPSLEELWVDGVFQSEAMRETVGERVLKMSRLCKLSSRAREKALQIEVHEEA